MDIIGETLTAKYTMIRESSERREKWDIVRTDTKELITCLGTVQFQKTLFRHKETGRSGGSILPFFFPDFDKREEQAWTVGEVCRGSKGILKPADKGKAVFPPSHPGVKKADAVRTAAEKRKAERVDQ